MKSLLHSILLLTILRLRLQKRDSHGDDLIKFVRKGFIFKETNTPGAKQSRMNVFTINYFQFPVLTTIYKP